MPSFETDHTFEINPDEFYLSCNKKEVDELLDILITEGYIDKNNITTKTHKKNVFDSMFDDAILKLRTMRLKISNEDIETIVSVLKKY